MKHLGETMPATKEQIETHKKRQEENDKNLRKCTVWGCMGLAVSFFAGVEGFGGISVFVGIPMIIYAIFSRVGYHQKVHGIGGPIGQNMMDQGDNGG
jgi:hypothetical protein